jgi:HAD superfamily hydrolase (TIGR01509 family)
MLEELKAAGKRMAIVTARIADVNDEIERKGLAGIFEIIISANDVKKKKPDPEGILKALSGLKAGKEESVFVGDASTDIKAATAAGIPSILYHPKGHSNFHDVEELMGQKPTHVASSYAELTKLIVR